VMTRLAVMLADLSAAEVYTERDHFDITVWLPQQKLLLVVENKIGSSESSNQLSKYRERVKQQYSEEKFCGVFLTAAGYDGEDQDWVSIGYTAIFSKLESLLQDMTVALAPDVRMTVKHYSQLIRKYIVTDEALVEACRSIYAKHRAALELIIEHGQVSLVREAAHRFLLGTHELKMARGGNRWRVNMVGGAWEAISSFQVADMSRWGPPCPLQFWFQLNEEKSELVLFLEVGPVQEGARFDRSKLVVNLREEFEVRADRTVSDIYTRIKRISTKVEAEDIDSIVKAMDKLWSGIGGSHRLKSIDAIVQDIAL